MFILLFLEILIPGIIYKEGKMLLLPSRVTKMKCAKSTCAVYNDNYDDNDKDFKIFLFLVSWNFTAICLNIEIRIFFFNSRPSNTTLRIISSPFPPILSRISFVCMSNMLNWASNFPNFSIFHLWLFVFLLGEFLDFASNTAFNSCFEITFLNFWDPCLGLCYFSHSILFFFHWDTIFVYCSGHLRDIICILLTAYCFSQATTFFLFVFDLYLLSGWKVSPKFHDSWLLVPQSWDSD